MRGTLTPDVEAGPPAVPGAPGAATRLAATDHLLAMGGLLLVVVALWLPFGLRVGPTFEEWKALYWSMERGGVPVLFPNRPLHYGPITLAHLSGQPLLALNLAQAGSIWGKGVLVYSLVVRLLPAGGALGFLAGVLAITYPADTGLFTLRTVQIHLAVLFDLVAVSFLLSLWERLRWWQWPAVWVTQVLSLSLHISSIPFQLASPMLLVWRERGLSRRLLGIWLAWSIVPAGSLALNVAYTLRGDTYEGSLWATSGLGPGLATTIEQMLGRTFRVYTRHFVTGWIEALSRLGPPWGDTGLALATVALAVAPVLWWHARRGPAPRSGPEARPYLELAALGLGAMPLGFLLFLPTRWGATDWRVFFHSSVAAAVVVAVLCGLVAATAGGLRRPVLVGLAGALVTVALTWALAQHRGYAETAEGQQRLLAGIVQAAPRLQPGTALLLVDVPPYPGLRHWRPCALPTECLEMSLRYVYVQLDLDAIFCAPGVRPRGERSELCRFEQDGVVVEYQNPWGPNRITRRYPYDRLVVFETSATGVRLVTDLAAYRPEGATRTYAPRARIDRTAAPSPRALAMLPQLNAP